MSITMPVALAVAAALALASQAGAQSNGYGFSCSLSGSHQVLIVESPRNSTVQQLCPSLASATHLHLRWGLHVIGGTLPVATWLYRKGGITVILQAEKLPATNSLIRAYNAIFSRGAWKRVAPRNP